MIAPVRQRVTIATRPLDDEERGFLIECDSRMGGLPCINVPTHAITVEGKPVYAVCAEHTSERLLYTQGRIGDLTPAEFLEWLP